jgi:hypothetical protein
VKTPWPIGLRAVFCLAVIGFLVSTGQFVYYFLMLRVSPHELGGKWALIGYVMGYVTIMVGAFRLRRPFTILLTAGCLYSIPFTAFQTWPMVQDFWKNVLFGGMTFANMLTWETWCLIWNSICLSLDIGVLLYLLSYEFGLFGPGKIRRKIS